MNRIIGEIADYEMREDGILVSYSKPVKRTKELIERNALLLASNFNCPVPVVVHICKSPVPDKVARIASNQYLPINYSKMAMVSEPGLAQFIMRILFKLKKPAIRMQFFQTEEDAVLWLKNGK